MAASGKRRPKSPQHTTFVSPLPSLTYGQVAALNHIVRGWLETDADLILSEGLMERIHTLVEAGEAFDPLLEGINTPNDLFIARTAYWAMQSVIALSLWIRPIAVRTTRTDTSTRGKRQKVAAPNVLEWLDQKDRPVDTFETPEKREDADADT